jgi:hypothetical protein
VRLGVRIDDFETGKLPRVCAKTGTPTRHTVEMRFATTQRWTLVLILFGVWPWVIASLFARDAAHGPVPMTEEAEARMRSARAKRLVASALAVAGLFLAFVRHSVKLPRPGLVAAVAVVLLVALYLWERHVSVKGAVHRRSGLIWLYGLHPTFVAEVHEKAERRRLADASAPR